MFKTLKYKTDLVDRDASFNHWIKNKKISLLTKLHKSKVAKKKKKRKSIDINWLAVQDLSS